MGVVNFWQDNIKKNIKKISGIFGDIVLTLISVTLFAWKAELDMITFLMMLVIGIKPFVTMYVNVVTKGEADIISKENSQLKQTIEYHREISEYRIRIAASTGKVKNGVISNKNWNDSNEALKKIETATNADADVTNNPL
ncbi:hypothetical protein LCGC14_1204460 [marine sediment metagenome]|uniref:Uncharacterized protein n=1 Tax=marine sediment metagenome TaxID=412755 RepID=A0A0F9LKB7_9ZZZZ